MAIIPDDTGTSPNGFPPTTTTPFGVRHENLRPDMLTPVRVYEKDATGNFLSGTDYAYGSGAAPTSGTPCVTVAVTPEDSSGSPIAARTVTSYYDAFGRLQAEQKASGATAFGYDGSGNVTSVAPPTGTATTYQYDDLGRVTQVGYGSRQTNCQAIPT